MYRNMLRSKIHRATVTGADLHYEGSATIDATLLEAADILPHQEEEIWRLSPKALDREKMCTECPFNLDGHCQVANLPIDGFQGCPRDEYEDAIWLVNSVLNAPEHQNPLKKKILDVLIQRRVAALPIPTCSAPEAY